MPLPTERRRQEYHILRRENHQSNLLRVSSKTDAHTRNSVQTDSKRPVKITTDQLRYRFEAIERELEALRALVIPDPVFAPNIKIAKMQRRILQILYTANTGMVHRNKLVTLVYKNKTPKGKALLVNISTLRRALKNYGIEIITKYNGGYVLDQENRNKLEALL